MKRKMMIILLVGLLCTGCTKSQVQKTNTESDSTATPVPTQEAAENPTKEPEAVVVPTQEPAATADSERYLVSLMDYQNSELIHVNYPVIKNWNLTEKEYEWNKRFYQDAQDALKDLEEGASRDRTYEVETQDDSLLSLQIMEYWGFPTTAHPYQSCSSINIDMTTGEIVALKDRVDTKELAKKIIEQNAYEIVSGVTDISIQDILDYNYFTGYENAETDLDKMSVILDNTDEAYENGFVTAYSYWREGELYLILGVCHAAGDYVILKIN